jgi:hypothetical protein
MSDHERSKPGVVNNNVTSSGAEVNLPASRPVSKEAIKVETKTNIKASTGTLDRAPPYYKVKVDLIGFVQAIEKTIHIISRAAYNQDVNSTVLRVIMGTAFRNLLRHVNYWASYYMKTTRRFDAGLLPMPREIAMLIASFKPAEKPDHPTYIVDPEWLENELKTYCQGIGYVEALSERIIFDNHALRQRIFPRIKRETFVTDLPDTTISTILSGPIVTDENNLDIEDLEKSVCMFLEADKHTELVARILSLSRYSTKKVGLHKRYHLIPVDSGNALLAASCSTWRKSHTYTWIEYDMYVADQYTTM